MMCMLPVFAALSDRYGRRVILGAGLIAQAIIVVPALAFMTHNPSQVLFADRRRLPGCRDRGRAVRDSSRSSWRGFGSRSWCSAGDRCRSIGRDLTAGSKRNVRLRDSTLGFGFYVLAVLAVGAACAISFHARPLISHCPHSHCDKEQPPARCGAVKFVRRGSAATTGVTRRPSPLRWRRQ